MSIWTFMALVGFLFEEPPLVLLELTMNILSLMVNKLSPRFVFERGKAKNVWFPPALFHVLLSHTVTGFHFFAATQTEKKSVIHSLFATWLWNSWKKLRWQTKRKVSLEKNTGFPLQFKCLYSRVFFIGEYKKEREWKQVRKSVDRRKRDWFLFPPPKLWFNCAGCVFYWLTRGKFMGTRHLRVYLKAISC